MVVSSSIGKLVTSSPLGTVATVPIEDILVNVNLLLERLFLNK
jgi:hypothetical protein